MASFILPFFITTGYWLVENMVALLLLPRIPGNPAWQDTKFTLFLAFTVKVHFVRLCLVREMKFFDITSDVLGISEGVFGY